MNNKYLANEYHSIMLFASLMVIYALVYMTKNCYSAAMVLLVDEGVLTKSQTGIISAVFYIVYAPFQIVGGFAADKYSPHKLILLGLVGATVANALIVLNTNYYFMLIVWALNGVVQFGVWPAVFKMASSSLAPIHRHKGIFYISLSSTLGLIFSYVIAGMVSSWKSNFVVSAVVLFICTIYWMFASRFFERNMVHEEFHQHGVAHLPEHKKEESKEKENFIGTLLKSGLMLILPVAMLQTVLSLGVQSLTPSMISESYESISPSLASVITIIPVIMGVAGKFIIKSAYIRMNHSECSILAVTIIASLPSLLVMLFVGKVSVPIMIVAISLLVLIANAASLIINPYLTVPFSQMGRAATVSGIINAMASLGIVVSNLVSTSVADNFGWIAVTVLWIVFVLVSAVITVIAYFPWKKFKKSLEK